MKTELTKAKEVYDLLDKWGCLKSLTDNEKKQIKSELVEIGKSAVMYAHEQTKDILPEIYKRLI